MATPITSILRSPTMSTSSFDIVSSRSRSSTTTSDIYFDDSDDEIIVWGVSDGSLSSSSESDLSVNGRASPASDDDFVVLSRPRSPPRVVLPRPSNNAHTPHPNTTTLASDLARLSVNEVSSIIRRNKKAAAAAATTAAKQNPGGISPKSTTKKQKKQTQTSQSPAPAPVSDRPSSVATLRKGSPSGNGAGGRRRRKPKSKSGSPVPDSGFGARPIVDDISEHPDSASEGGHDEFMSMYDAAASYINSCLADPSSVCRLTLLQALIIELGLASSSLPASLTAARAIIKSRVFLNVGEYLDARAKGPVALQQIMHKSKSSLIRDLKKKRNRISLQWVKETGLQVLLVSCYHH